MLTFIAFLLTLMGSINWLLIGLLQYDFIAGLFGYQASMFSRLVYILYGVAAIYLVIRIIVNKGTFKVFEKRKKKNKKTEEIVYAQNDLLATERAKTSNENNLFDEHLKD